MKIQRTISLSLAFLLLAACNGTGIPAISATSTSPYPTPRMSVTRAPDPLSAIDAFMRSWKADDYAAMYEMLAQESRNAITAEDFSKRYTDAMNNLTLRELDYSIGALDKHPDNSQVNFRVTYKTNMVGDLLREMSATLKMESGQWRIVWDDGLVMPDLKGGNTLKLDVVVPPRGNIYDASGRPIVSQTDAVAIGVIPSLIDLETEGSMVASIANLVDLYPGTIRGMYPDGATWYIPIGEVSQEDYQKRSGGVLFGFPGVYQYPYNTRFYTNGVAPQVIGYVSAIQGEELNSSLRLGYARSQLIGRTGIERWGQEILAGKNGGVLHVVAPDGTVLADLGSSEQKPGSDVYLTVDRTLQYYIQRGLEGLRGAVVVLERDSGKVLAMASSPGYNPNFFDPANENSPGGVAALVNDPNTPQLNRAAQSVYPLGSVFKVVTFAAALESGTYTPTSELDCPYHFTELPDRVMDDWTYDHYLDELAAGETVFTQPSGVLSLTGALRRSCNPWFWHIGKDLYDQGRVTAIADMARGFGLGQPTGITEIEENAGTIMNPPGLIEAVNQAIGQGDVQVTPLQVARMMAAIGNGGKLYRPQLVDRIVDANGITTQVFKPEANARPLPVTFETLKALQAAMREVIYHPRGTAFPRFYGIRDRIPLYGKTGTAESGNGDSHAWFGGYTDANNPDLPDIAIAVIAENAGEGSQVAAPIFKRVVEIYFNGRPLSPYPWEADIGITRTPTQPVTPTIGP